MTGALSPAMSSQEIAPDMPSDHQPGDNSQELTPRSKVKALLAAIEDEDSDDNSPRGQRSDRPALAPISGNLRLSPTKSRTLKGKRATDDTDSDEDSPIIPRGKIAARLNNVIKKPETSAGDEPGASEEPAYERIKRRLLNSNAGGVTKVSIDGPGDRNQSGNTKEHPIASPPPVGIDTVAEHEALPSTPPRAEPPVGPFISPSTPSESPAAVAPRSLESSSSAAQPDVHNNNRFLELVAKKRAEREARELEEEKKRAERLAKSQDFEKILSEDASAGSSEDDSNAEKRLEKSTRPARKASKKALEEMSRETQRMNRNMQLAHQAKTKKKISKDALFARFNFRNEAKPPANRETPNSSTTVSSAPPSDREEDNGNVSPPTSPMEANAPKTTSNKLHGSDKLDHLSIRNQDDLPSLEALLSESREIVGRQEDDAETNQSASRAASMVPKQKIIRPRGIMRVPPMPTRKTEVVDLDSNSDQETLEAKKSKPVSRAGTKLDAFRKIPAPQLQVGRSLQALRALAHLHRPEENTRNKKPSMTASDMQVALQRRARLQAKEERKAKIADLEARGIFVRSAEEREKDQVEVESMLEKARHEAEQLKQKEKQARKKENRKGEGINGPDGSEESDEDYQDQDDHDEVDQLGSTDGDDASDEESERAGASEEEDEDDAKSDQETGDAQGSRADLFDQEADEDAEGEEDDIIDNDEGGMNKESDDTDGYDEQFEVRKAGRHRGARFVLVEEDDEDDAAATAHNKELQIDGAEVVDKPEGRLRIESVASPSLSLPRFPILMGKKDTTVSLGLTQAFEGTMAETQDLEMDQDGEETLNAIECPPEPDLPFLDSQVLEPMVLNSQHGESRQDLETSQDNVDSGHISLHFTQTQLNAALPGDSQLQPIHTQCTELPDPTQDAGFVPSSPVLEPEAGLPPSTVDTVLIPAETGLVSPPKRKGRLRRRDIVMSDSENEDQNLGEGLEAEGEANAFVVMERNRKKAIAQAAFDRKRSNAKEMVEEQAQESEDEYAGLGGASDDESGGEEDEDVRKMMDHGEVHVDERALAALHADKERASDEKAIEKLYKDINNGGLRRKRGADMDLSDSEDDAEARRRRKQREFAKMRKALLADEKVGQIAEDPRKFAFLRAIEDREDLDGAMDFLDHPSNEISALESSTQDENGSQIQQVHESGSEINRERKRPLQETNPNMRPPAFARRTNATAKKPSTLAEIRESVSFLVEVPGAIQEADASSSASEAEGEEATETRLGSPQREECQHPRRTPANPIIDRLSLKRASSTSSNATTTTTTTIAASTTRLAFFASNSDGLNDGFKVPSLLRRATTQVTGASVTGVTTTSTHAITERAAGGGGKEGFGAVKMGGGKSSSVNFFMREKDKRSVTEGVERKRRADKERKAKERREGGLGKLMLGARGGGFD